MNKIKTLLKSLVPWLLPTLLVMAFLVPVIAFAQSAASPSSGTAAMAATKVSPWMAIIPVLVPVLIGAVKWLVPDVPSWMLPVLAPLLGAAADIVLNYAGVPTLGATWSALLGSAGVGLREIQDQLKQRVSPPVTPPAPPAASS